ncbi:stringent starvation protein B [Isorropodon fossajaponicum endosymbiont JTNG4]|uniref:ClpXP protease specificity-enhancing factor SspB n=1 Tax=Isorropodon fossajaponicum symbiont TaxID=883811 RepID=UPI0019368813|nr:ClpXP protease specificity-enhancing factor SspB [Isorropodon fossajaponicum symbiont]BBB24295.1 stringent starvation protein B [Isorropodon fossajaponicum endosymbiont JTNG4]
MVVPSVAPYLIRAYHAWMEDTELTPHILVDCTYSGVVVPKQFIQQDKIVLNIASNATHDLVINNNNLSFKARFSNKSVDIFVPINAVASIYAGENGEGMFFEVGTKTTEEKKPNLTLLD